VLIVDCGPVLIVDGGPMLLEDGGPLLLAYCRPLLFEDGCPVLLEDGGPFFRGNFHGAQWIQDVRGVSEDALDSDKGGGSCSTANCNNEDTFTFSC
jgi:hypothetical protein